MYGRIARLVPKNNPRLVRRRLGAGLEPPWAGDGRLEVPHRALWTGASVVPPRRPPRAASARSGVHYRATAGATAFADAAGGGYPHRLSSVLAASTAPVRPDDDETDHADDDSEEELIADSITRMFRGVSLSTGHFARRSAASVSSLDLELGEASVWDASHPGGSDPEEDTDDGMGQPQRGAAHTHRRAVELLEGFDPQCPPTTDDPHELQLWLECLAQQEAVQRYQRVIDGARDRRDYAALSALQRQVLRWFPALCAEIQRRQDAYVLNRRLPEDETNRAMKRYGPFLCTLSPEKLAVIAAHAGIMHMVEYSGTEGRGGVPLVSIAKRIGAAVEEEVLIHRVLHKHFFVEDTPAGAAEEDADDVPVSDAVQSTTTVESMAEETEEVIDKALLWSYSASHLRKYMEMIDRYSTSSKRRRAIAYAVRRARKVLEADAEWSNEDKIQLGAVLLHVLLNHSQVKTHGRPKEMAFTCEKRWVQKNKMKTHIHLNDSLYKMIVSDKLHSLGTSTTRYKPMILPPKPWRGVDDGAYLWLKPDVLRYHGCRMQKEALNKADLTTVFDGLNTLGRVGWRINKSVLAVAQRCWDEDIPLGDIPSQTDFQVPEEPSKPKWSEPETDKSSPVYQKRMEEARRYREDLIKFRRMRQKNMDLRSLRCSAMLKLDQATRFQDFDRIYFPYNMDFRGRAYPIPPHLSNVGSDLCRGMLIFAEGKQLGPRGLYWLKVHLANFAGKDKMTFDDRAAFVDENIESIRQSVEDPFEGDRWWMNLEDPFQGLATCIEIIKAIDSGNPETYVCHLPVHMDGSCNGLQHYAALGRDLVGGKAVNLCATEEPQDVYVGVMHEVIRRVAEEASREVDFDISDIDALSKKQKKALNNNRAAKLVNGLIDRGVVKRTVMTSVYGVTYIGARQQIQEKIEEKLEGQGLDVDEMGHEIFLACGYLARVTMDVMGDLFSGAKETMNWLTTCARLITQHNAPVAWVTPIGLPAIQPYRQKKTAMLVTLLQSISLTSESDDMPIHKQRQVSAFPPNYVHSLDSSHMLLTALEMEKRHLTFSAVHDSFWTHACDVDEMNGVLRDVFIDLYEQPLLERLKQGWELRYPDLTFPDVPKRGPLDLNEVRLSKYFFQ